MGVAQGPVLYVGGAQCPVWYVGGAGRRYRHMEESPGILSPLPGEDAAENPELSEERLLDTLHTRYLNQRVYTYIGDILIAVNPLQPLPLYGPEVSDVYSSRPLRLLPPHIFAVADRAYNALQTRSVSSSGNQCIVISGDSGAGKTESTKLLLRHVVRRSRGNSQLCQQILQVNPLLEAFGNAETVMNQNSSRFGKYIQLRFSAGSVRGAKINEYLLEKSRVSHQDLGERNFHVFYYMLFGCPAEEKEVYGLLQPSMYRYIGRWWEESDTRRWSDGYQTLCNAMRMVGFHDQEELDLKTILSGVLSLGNIVFESEEAGGVSVSSTSMGWLKAAAGQFGVQTEDLMNCLICTTSVTRGEAIRRLHSKQQAEDSRDSIARVVYSRLFGWIVTKVNELLAGDVMVMGRDVQEIGILDIFGFENFAVNRFEQLCINLANEQLQNFFNQHIFLMEQQHYREEGILEDAVTFTNNQPILDLILARPWGILSILDEQTSFPQASDASFVDKFSAGCRTNPHYERTRGKDPGFAIHHYAGKVQYTAVGFLEKNRDTIPMNIQNLFISSETLLLSLLFTASISRTGTLMPVHREKAQISQDKASTRKMSVGAQFRRSLAVLMEKMSAANPHFIRCIKPNNEKTPGVFRPDEVLKQLRYNGLMETLRIRRDGFSWRPSFQDFVGQYGILLLTPDVPVSRDSCIQILQGAQLSGWQCGTSRLFFKYWHQDEMTQRLRRLRDAVTTVQKRYKGLVCRRAFLNLLDEMRKLEEEQQAERERVKRQEEEEQAERERVKRLEEEAERERLKRQEEKDQAERERVKRREKEQAERESVKRREEEAEQERVRQREQQDKRERERRQEDQQASRRAMPRPVPVPRRKLPPLKPALCASLSEPPVPRPRSRLFQLSPFDNPAVRPRVSSICCEDGDNKLLQRRKTLLWFKETQAEKVQDGGVFPPWLHGMISRREAENLLVDKEPGDFLVRISQTRAGYILSYKSHSCCRHYMVDVRSNGCYVILGEDRAHTSLVSLVEFHRTTGIQPYGEKLREPCGKMSSWEPDCEELKFLKRTLSLNYENLPCLAPPMPEESSGVSRLAESSLLHRKSIRRAMHEIQQSSPVHMNDGCKAEERRASSVR